ncbi:unnamed protein product [Zymoseptoria tritici ST99CH_1A5]|uniref:Uncharacterized protein n=1 Tax=Zymoseptoria tritici ST99CH_1A5 TaxID=1276529 RepID=A0A1Y6LG72_ZYMTR|nr:unnamed protein product [Zymoseptoria tritici ST99CH_1A5]
MCFGAVVYLIGAAGGDSASLDATAELLDVLKDITVRLAVYNQEDLSRELQYKLAEILTTVIEVFARSTKVVEEGVLHRMKAFDKNLLLGNDSTMQDMEHQGTSPTKSSSNLSRKLKGEIKQALTEKANGMFMWARLMISELSKKSRASAIRDALNSAPKGLAEMLRHVLLGMSAAIKDPQDAEYLNDMLMCVTLAKRPLSLGELDDMLGLKSPDGEGVLNPEGKLRIQFASIFALTREDTMTTADLQSQRNFHTGEEDEDATAGANVDEEDGLDDVENDTEFSSNPATTSVGFVHASISDFFKDRKQGNINAGVDAPAIGVHVEEAALSITKTCLDLVVEDALLDRMDQAVSLRP